MNNNNLKELKKSYIQIYYNELCKLKLTDPEKLVMFDLLKFIDNNNVFYSSLKELANSIGRDRASFSTIITTLIRKDIFRKSEAIEWKSSKLKKCLVFNPEYIWISSSDKRDNYYNNYMNIPK